MLGIKTVIINKYCVENKIKIIKNSISFSDAEQICKQCGANYVLDEICNVDGKLRDAAILKDPINTEKITVGIVGHINHGKTTLVRNIIDEKIHESYNITQNLHIYDHKDLFLIDTPGHEIFDFIRDKIIDAVNCFGLVISLREGIEKETEKTISLLIENRIEDRVFIIFTKNDVAKFSPVVLLKELSEKYFFNVDKYIVTSKDDKDTYEKLYAQVKIFKKYEPDFDGFLINTQLIENQVCYLIKIEKDVLDKKSFLIFDDKIARVTKIRTIKNYKNVTSIESITFAYVCLDTTVSKSARFFITSNEDLAFKYDKILNIKNHLKQIDKVVGQQSRDCLFVFLVSDAITKEAISKLIESYKIENNSRIITSLNNITVASIDNCSKVLSFNYAIDPKIQRDIEKTNTFIYFDSIYEIMQYLSENVNDMATNTKILSIASIIKVFNIKTSIIAGCKIIKGEFAMGDKVVVTTDEEDGKYTLRDAFESTVVSLKKKDSFAKKVKIHDEVGIILNKFTDYKEGMYIVKLQSTDTAPKRRKRRR